MPTATAKFPPYHYNCRSAVELVFDGYQSPKERTSENGLVENKSYYEWLKEQPSEYQDEILGKKRAKLFRDGGLSIERFKQLQLDKHFTPMTLKQMQEAEPLAFKRAFGGGADAPADSLKALQREPVILGKVETIDKWLLDGSKEIAQRSYESLNKAQFKLDFEQFASISYYTGNGYENLNRYLNGFFKPDKKTKTVLESAKVLLNDSLAQLPKAREKRVYRWLYLTPEQKANYTAGSEIELPAFVSTTYDKNKKVDIEGGANVRLIIEHKTGRKIEKLSRSSSEKEILLPSNTKHVVKSVKEKKKDGELYTEIELLEITE